LTAAAGPGTRSIPALAVLEHDNEALILSTGNDAGLYAGDARL
jgi:hypothetical protein